MLRCAREYTVLTSRRKQAILKKLQLHGQVQVSALSREWQISPDSVRRDLRDLAGEGLLQRVHGGALPAAAASADYADRERLSPDAKQRIGRTAAALVRPGQVIAVDGGTTTLQLVRHLPRSLEATVVTHSPTIAAALRHHATIEVILIGGRLFKHSMVAIGTTTTDAIASIHTDLFFLGATGVHIQSGVTTGSWEEAAVKRAFCDKTAEVVLLVTPEKLNAASPFGITTAAELDVMVCDYDASEQELAPYRELGVTVLTAERA